MPSKLLLRNFQLNQTYHIRHVAKLGTELFRNDSDYKTFVLLLSYYLRFPNATPLSWVSRLNPATVIAKQKDALRGTKPTVLHSFLLLPDHFHLVLTEKSATLGQSGISNLMRRVSVAYAMYYNKTHGVTGTIYKGKYKTIPIPQDSLPRLLHSLHYHQGVNNAFLESPLHSSAQDYLNSPRNWIFPLPVSSAPIEPSRLLLD